VRTRAALDLAQQRLDDARVTAPCPGTIIGKPVALGQVIQSGTSAAGGGTTIVKMADLTKVRARALVNETDIGQVRPGMEATVTVDAFPIAPSAARSRRSSRRPSSSRTSRCSPSSSRSRIATASSCRA
jgi:multidrug resistance efflux pump